MEERSTIRKVNPVNKKRRTSASQLDRDLCKAEALREVEQLAIVLKMVPRVSAHLANEAETCFDFTPGIK